MQLITTAEVATRLGKSVRTVIRLVDAGELTPVTKTPGLRGAYLFDERYIARYIARRDKVAAELAEATEATA